MLHKNLSSQESPSAAKKFNAECENKMKKRRRKAAQPKLPSTPRPVEQQRAEPLFSTSRLAIVVALLAFVPYVNTFSNDFVLDDVPIVVENPVIRDLSNVGRMLTTNFWGEEVETEQHRGLYRPVTNLSYALDYAFWDLKPTGYHIVNVALHAITTVVLFLIAINLLQSSLAAFTAASIFAVHPIHTEAVTGIVGRTELLAALFFLLAFWFGRPEAPLPFLRPRSRPDEWRFRAIAIWGGAALLYLFGLLSKEIAVSLPAVLLVYDLTRGEESGDKLRHSQLTKSGLMFLRYVGFAIALVAYFALRNNVIKNRNIWVGFIGVPFEERVLTASRVLMEYLALLIYPRTLMADYWKPDVPIARSPGEPLVLLSLLLWGVLVVAAVYSWRKARPLFFCIAWFFITVMPVSNLPFAIGLGKAERILYLPSAGFSLLVGGLFGLAGKKIGRIWPLMVVLIPILSILTIRTYERNKDWKNNLTLAQATLEVSPTSPLLNQIAASEYRTRGETEKGVSLLQEAIRQRPEEYSYHYNLGNVYLDLKQYNQAIASYQEALRLKPGYLKALNNLGQAQMGVGNNSDAVKTFTTLLSIDRKYQYAYPNLGSAYINLGNLAEAARIFREGLVVFPDFAELHLSLALVLEKMGQVDEAAQEHQKAIALDPSLKGKPQ